MIQITLQYIPVDTKAAFLAVKTEEIRLTHYKISFFAHVYSSILILIIGAFQFSKKIRLSMTNIHRTLGKIYVFLVLFIAAPSGFVMGVYGNGGIYAQISFCLLSLLWFIFTLLAFLKIKQRNFIGHRNFMILSYSLTLSAISLRLFKWIISTTIELPPMETYRIVVWLGWIVNLLIALVIIQKKQKPIHLQ